MSEYKEIIYVYCRDGKLEARNESIVVGNVPYYRDDIADQLAEALAEVDDWFNNLKHKQNELLGHGLQQACDNWDAATKDVEIFDMGVVQAAIEAYRKAKGEWGV